jgi:hypothetical protein
MKTNSPFPRPGPTVALVVALLQEAYPNTWEQLLRNRLGATDPADLTPAEFAEFTEHVFWLVKQRGIKDPAAWLAFRAQLDAQEAPAAPAKLGSRPEIDHLAVHRKSAEREPIAFENSPATTSATSPARPPARIAYGTTKAEVLSRRDTAERLTAAPPSQMTSPDIDSDVQNPGAAGSRKIGAKPPSALQQPLQAGERVASGDTPDRPEAEDGIDEITIRSKRYVSADRLAWMLGIARRSLTRLCTDGKAPPQIKIGNKVFFEVPLRFPESIEPD